MGNIWYIRRNLPHIKTVMITLAKDQFLTEMESAHIMKWLIDVERSEQEEDMQKISEVVESLFLMIHRKIVNNKLQLSFKDQDQDSV